MNTTKQFSYSPIAFGVLVTLLLFGLLVGCGGDSNNGKLTIRGTLLEETTRSLTRTDGEAMEGETIRVPIVGAIVRAVGQSVVTDSNGEFVMQAFDDGYKGEPIVFEVTLNETTRNTTTVTTSTGPQPDLFGNTEIGVNLVKRDDRTQLAGFFLDVLVRPIAFGMGSPTPSPLPTSEPSPTPELTPSPSPSEEATPEETETVEPTTQSTEEASPTPELNFSDQFTCENGRYNAGNSQGCGIDKFTLARFEDSTDQLRVTGFGENEDLKFIIIGDGLAEANGVIVFSQGDHRCEMRCSPPNSITVFCSNNQGGTCQQTLTK